SARVGVRDRTVRYSASSAARLSAAVSRIRPSSPLLLPALIALLICGLFIMNRAWGIVPRMSSGGVDGSTANSFVSGPNAPVERSTLVWRPSVWLSATVIWSARRRLEQFEAKAVRPDAEYVERTSRW